MNYIKTKINMAWNWVKNNVKKTLIVIGFLGVASAMIVGAPVGSITLENPQVISWTKPTTNAQWAEDTKKESLHFKFDYQLLEMKISHEKKLPKFEEYLRKFVECPECIKWELKEEYEQFFDKAEVSYDKSHEGKTLQQWIDGEFAEQKVNTTWKVEKLQQSIERINKEIELRDSGFLTVVDKIPAGNPARNNIKANERSPLGTTFFIDADCATPGDGSLAACTGAGTDSFDDFLDFTEVARSAGDIAIARRGRTATYDDGTPLSFLSDGLSGNPITLTADYIDAWGDFASSSQTYTPVFGSKLMASSASTTGIVAGDWIFVQGDDQRDFAYEIESLDGSNLTFYLPYKGVQSGSGNTLNVMPDAPIHGEVTSGTINVACSGDDYWLLQGWHGLSSSPNGVLNMGDCVGSILKDMIAEANGASDLCMNPPRDYTIIKMRLFNCQTGVSSSFGSISFYLDSLFDGNDVASGTGLDASGPSKVYDTEFKNWATGALSVSSNEAVLLVRNIVIDGSPLTDTPAARNNMNLFFEDFNNVIGDNRFHTNENITTLSLITKSTTTPLRSGGGATSIEVIPTTGLGGDWETGSLLLFEYPIHTDTTSKDYQVFFKAGTTTVEFLTSPTAKELWIECEYWATSGSPNHRRLKKTTSTMDFTTDADFDQSLTITCAPSQTGILYLRGWYAKTLESGIDNVFFVDPRPVITDT